MRLPDSSLSLSLSSLGTDDSDTELDARSSGGKHRDGFGTDGGCVHGMDAALGLVCSGEYEEAKLEALRVLGSESRGRCGDNTVAAVECWWRFGPWLDACQSEDDDDVCVCVCVCTCVYVCLCVCVCVCVLGSAGGDSGRGWMHVKVRMVYMCICLHVCMCAYASHTYMYVCV
jgi:hypothetical protein